MSEILDLRNVDDVAAADDDVALAFGSQTHTLLRSTTPTIYMHTLVAHSALARQCVSDHNVAKLQNLRQHDAQGVVVNLRIDECNALPDVSPRGCAEHLGGGEELGLDVT